jgi:transketolase
LRPGDAAETEVAWRVAVERTDGPSWLALSRQKVAVYDRSQVASAEGLRRGAYVFQDASNGTPVAIVMASGSELELAVSARDRLEAEGIPTRVVSFPSWHLFQQQDSEYRDSVLPSSIKNRVSIEAASTFGWSRWTGDAGHSVGIDHFGASAPAEVLYEKFGVTVDAVVEAVKAAR